MVSYLWSYKFFFTKIGKKWAKKLTLVIFWENFLGLNVLEIMFSNDGAISQKMKRVTIKSISALSNGEIGMGFFFGTEEVHKNVESLIRKHTNAEKRP